jgi:hypothetical protein
VRQMIERIFQATDGFLVPDGTHVFPFLNSNDVGSGLPPGLLDDFSLAIGEIGGDSCSKIHVHPCVKQVTMVIEGRLDVRMRRDPMGEPVTIHLAQHQAVLTQPGDFLQLINRSRFSCRVIYVVGPAYVFLINDDGQVIYDDAVSLDESWEQLAEFDWKPPGLLEAKVARKRRDDALRRIHRSAENA